MNETWCLCNFRGPVPVLVMSLIFIASVFMLHIWGKYTRGWGVSGSIKTFSAKKNINISRELCHWLHQIFLKTKNKSEETFHVLLSCFSETFFFFYTHVLDNTRFIIMLYWRHLYTVVNYFLGRFVEEQVVSKWDKLWENKVFMPCLILYFFIIYLCTVIEISLTNVTKSNISNKY